MHWPGSGDAKRLAALDAHPVGVLAQGETFVLTAHGTPFVAGPAFTATNQFLVLSRDGKLLGRTAAPNALFLNGIAALPDGAILAADSLAGRIWRFEPATGTVSEWLVAAELTQDTAKPPHLPGANGLKLRDGWLHVSNSSRGTLSRLRVVDGKPGGAIEIVANTGPIDDFAFLSDGSIAAATHGARLIRIAANGAVTDILATGCDGCTSVAVHGADEALLVLTTGNLLEGGKEPARLLRLSSPLRSR
jgi:sugar lactone lactonase YvrE